MSFPLTVERRRVLQILCALGVAGLRAPRAPAATQTSALLAGIDVNALQELGKAYRQLEPGVAAFRDVPSLTQLRRLMRVDFENGNIVVLSGWHLSRTEGRLLTTLLGE